MMFVPYLDECYGKSRTNFDTYDLKTDNSLRTAYVGLQITNSHKHIFKVGSMSETLTF